MYRVECGKCGGTGTIQAYNHIVGGTCFSCAGRGYFIRKTKPAVKEKYLISAVDKEDNTRKTVFYITETSEKKALTKAIKTLTRGNGYFPETAEIVKQ